MAVLGMVVVVAELVALLACFVCMCTCARASGLCVCAPTNPGAEPDFESGKPLFPPGWCALPLTYFGGGLSVADMDGREARMAGGSRVLEETQPHWR